MSTREMTFRLRDDQPDCSVCERPAPLAKTSHGLLCSRCVLTFLRRPRSERTPRKGKQQGGLVASSDVRALTSSLL